MVSGRRGVTSLVALVTLVGFVAACSGTPVNPVRADKGSETQVASSQSGGAVTPSPTEPTEPAEPEPVTLAFGGDVNFQGVVADRLAADPASVLAGVAPVLERADVAMVNLETAITDRGDPAPKAFTFRAPRSAFQALRSAGVDVVTMANNHGMDYGLVGLEDSLRAAHRSHFPVVGIGADADEAFAPYWTTVRGQRLAFIGATQVLDSNLMTAWTATDDKPGLASAYDVDRLVAAVEHARRDADTVVVYLHWGQELNPCPLDRQRELARRLIRAGADVLVGGHAHRLLAGGYLRGRYVHYGLGNFVFYSAHDVTAQTGILQLTVEGRKVTKAKWKPAVISGGIPHLEHGADARTARAEWKDLRSCTDLRDGP